MYHSRRPWVQVVGLPCALLDLRPLPTGTLEDLPRSIACLVANHRAVDPRDLGLSFEAPATTAGILASLFAGTSPDDHRHGSHPLLGFARFASLHRHTNHASTPRSRSSLRADGTTRFDSCSAHVVSHHLDGSQEPCFERIAARCRTWGSPRCQPLPRRGCRSTHSVVGALPVTHTPFEGLLLAGSWIASPRPRCPLAVRRRPHRGGFPFAPHLHRGGDGLPSREPARSLERAAVLTPRGPNR